MALLKDKESELKQKFQLAWTDVKTKTFLIMALVFSLCLVVGFSGLQYYLTTYSSHSLKQVTDSILARQVSTISHHLNTYQEDLKQYSNRKAFNDAVIADDKETLNSFITSLQKTFDDAIHIRIIKKDQAKLDREHKSPIRFTELDVIGRIESRQQVPLEALKVDQQWQFNLFSPIPSDEDQAVIATLMVTLPEQNLYSLLADAPVSAGHFQLFQKFTGNKAMTISQSGTPQASNALEGNIPNSYWHLRYSPSEATIHGAQTSALPFIGGWLIVTLILLAGTQQVCRYSFGDQYDTARTKPASYHMNNDTGPLQLEDALELNLDLNPEDEGLFNSSSSLVIEPTADDVAQAQTDKPAAIPTLNNDNIIHPQVFRAYDIRGIAADSFSIEFVHLLGKALGSEALDQGEHTLIIGRDCRTHSPEIAQQLSDAIRSTGCHVIDLGIVPTPLVYFATHVLSASKSGVIVTASHNGPEYNGFKMVFARNTISEQGIQYIKQRMQQRAFTEAKTAGQLRELDISTDYIEHIFSDIALAGGLSVVIDAGNGAASEIAPRLFEELGCEVTPLYCEFDGSYPNHQADPSQEKNLLDLIEKVKEVGADLGIALDGDGDRLGVVTPQGKIIWPDRQLMLFAKDIVSRNPGTDVLFDVKCTRQLNSLIASYGGRPIMWKTGHSLMKAKMQETGALLGGELSGHIFFKERWFGFDDGMYAAARLLEIMSLRDQDLDTIFNSFPDLPNTPEIKISISDERKFEVVKEITSHGHFGDGKLTTIDGLRVDFPYGWGLVRASNTSPCLTLRFEAKDQTMLDNIQEQFRVELAKIDSSLTF